MMVAVFALMLMTLVTGLFAPARIAVGCMLVCLGATIWLFLSDIHNRDYGFGLPWLEVESDLPGASDRAGDRT